MTQMNVHDDMFVITICPGEWRRLQDLGWFRRVHATFGFEAEAFDMAPSLPQDDPTQIPHSHGCTVKIRVLGVVLHTVRNHEVEIGLKLVQAVVLVRLYTFPHGGEVHGVFNVVQIIRYLKGTHIH